MIRQLFTAAPAAQSTRLVSRATLTTPSTQPLACHLPKQRSIPSALRPFSQTTLARFSLSAVQKSSPFRLSSDKNTPFPFPEEDPYSQYPPKRQWPPDMTKLSQKHQFRLERKYRRRAALKYARPQFIKAVTLAQWVIIGFVAIYAVLFMDWDTKDTPFDGIRENVFSSIGAVFSSPPPPSPVKRTEEKD